ncbi:hypothetical protein F4780DRAFT_384949 [Xylariomycetidae sp. FL0641]|nr:hypothetical protein F4780DRAFT_384949 [Xylariomycetidae sp. FL0641]
MDDEVDQFMAITGVESEQVARGYLQISGNSAMAAVQTFFDNPDLAASFTGASAASASQPTASSRGQPSRSIGREDAQGVIHIDSDDDNDVAMTDPGRNRFAVPDNDDDFDDDDDDDVAAVARNAQEEEDAAMARRLQEELYGHGGGGQGASEDGVRAPIARTTETLMAPGPSWGGMDDDRESAILEQLRARQRPPRHQPGSNNPFQQSRSMWGGSSSGASRPDHEPSSRVASLADAFAEPRDLMECHPGSQFQVSWDEARDMGKEHMKWILVNLQNEAIFACHSLNRDIWKDERIKALVREHFIFLQWEKKDPDALDYIQFYFPNEAHEIDDNYPHVSIIDPRTGEQVKVWSGDGFPKADAFYQELIEFLDRYSLAANSKNPVAQSKPKPKHVDVERLTEEEQLELALKNSMEANGGPSGSTVQDPDSFTMSGTDNGKGKGKEAEAQAQPPSKFQQVSSSNPHVEPEHNPATTTRIQFKHPGGRVIRRFAVSDPVRRIYEWLKTEPFEGKEGVEFELKAIPGGDLIEKLDQTIEETGLKQGTVMIEFVEEE